MTVATLALMRGDKLKPDITMTGTINPDGTIGPVGGIPYKVDGVLAAHKTKMLIPAGQRNSADDSGTLVDVVQLGQRKGVTVTEVDNIYDAYKAFTGNDLPRAAPATDVKLDETTYQKLKAKVETWNARFSTSVGEFNSLAPTIRNDLQSIADQANSYHQQATKLSDEGLQAGAFQKAVQAAAFANAAAHTGQSFQILLTQGVRPFVSRIKASQSVTGQVNGLVDELKTFTPETVSDTGALIAAYGNAIDAVSFSQSGANLLNASASTAAQAATQATLGAVYYDLAGTLVTASKDVLDVGRGLGGPKLGSKLDLNDIADFFRKAAEANLNAFESLIIEPAANDANISLASAKGRFANNDSDYSLSVSGLNVMGGLQKYFGDAATSDYAEIGGAVSLYNRTAGLIAKYYSLGEVDPTTLNVTGISNDQAFTAAIELAQNQLASTVGLLRAKSVSPTIAVADNEIAGVDREGTPSDKLSALTDYWDGYLSGRVLAYIGGFAKT
jgi:Archaeal serine proteases